MFESSEDTIVSAAISTEYVNDVMLICGMRGRTLCDVTNRLFFCSSLVKSEPATAVTWRAQIRNKRYFCCMKY